MLYHAGGSYGPPDGFNWDHQSFDDPVMDDDALEDNNVKLVGCFQSHNQAYTHTHLLSLSCFAALMWQMVDNFVAAAEEYASYQTGCDSLSFNLSTLFTHKQTNTHTHRLTHNTHTRRRERHVHVRVRLPVLQRAHLVQKH
jgi:hypothetical protein